MTTQRKETSLVPSRAPKFRFVDADATRAALQSQNADQATAVWVAAAVDTPDKAAEAKKVFDAQDVERRLDSLRRFMQGWEAEYLSHETSATAKAAGKRADDGIDNAAAMTYLASALDAAGAELDALDPPKKKGGK